MTTSRRYIRAVAFAGITIAAVVTQGQRGDAQQDSARTAWRTYGGDKGFARYSALDQINRENVKNLQPVWRRPAIDPQLTEKFPDLVASNYFRGTPIMIDGVLYAPNGVGLVEAFDAATGRTIWVQQPARPILKEATGESTRGVAYWHKDADERIIAVRGEYLYALEAKTGTPCRGFGENGRVFLNRHTPDEARYFGFPGPIVVGDVIVIGGNGGGKAGEGYGDDGFDARAKPEDIRGYDVRTGKQLWTFHVLPQKGEPGAQTWGKGSEFVGNMAAWASLTADEELGYVYVPLSAPTVSYYGGHRPGQNLYSDSLVVLNARTGQRVWHFQMVHHDLWDYDSATPPVLGDITVDGKKIKAVFASNKTGFLYVFDRVNGTPVWPIEEKPVPQSNVPGEVTSPTQPFPSKPPALDRQGITEDDLIDFTPELRKKALEVASQYVMGPLFTPPTLKSLEPKGKKGTLAVPNAWGSANWNTGAFDPETGVYYAVSWAQPGTYGLTKAVNPTSTMAYSIGTEPTEHPRHTNEENEKRIQPDFPRLSIDGLPLTKPPYSRLTALNLNTGTLLWSVPNGDGPRNHPLLKDLHLPPLGNPGRPVALVTKTLLFLGDSSNAVFGTGGISGPAKFRAYDKASGQVIAEKDLPVGTTGGPMTYLAGGKQYIVVPIGGKAYGAGWVAFAVGSEGITLTSMAPGRATGVAPATYTDAQASRGDALFQQRCASCHLQNGFGPPLRGNAFWRSWDGKSARSLYSTIISSMPPDDPGSLTEKNVVDTVAYIFRINHLPAGTKEIKTAADLNGVALVRPK